MTTIERKYNEKCATPSDIHEHLPVLRRYAEECDHILELGVRTVVSTWALLAGLAVTRGNIVAAGEGGPAGPPYRDALRSLMSVDLAEPEKHGGNLREVGQAVSEINQMEGGPAIVFMFVEEDSRKLKVDYVDLLFIDTWHVYEQLAEELRLHGNKTRKYIILHDTTTFGERGETAGHRGLWPAVQEFLDMNPHWVIAERLTNNNGLTVLKRV